MTPAQKQPAALLTAAMLAGVATVYYAGALKDVKTRRVLHVL
jgi:hypothetical protein